MCIQELPVRHTLDVMHVEKNVAATLTGFLLGEEDTVAVRKDMQECSVMEDLHLVREGQILPHASCPICAESGREKTCA